MEDGTAEATQKGFTFFESNQLLNIPVAIAAATIIFWHVWKLTALNPFLAHCKDVYPNGCGEHARREKLLKTGFRPDRVPDDVFAIVIGSGMAGLTCAGLLARAGKKVLVLEQHDCAGGSTHVFEEKGFEFDVGVHYVGGMGSGSMNHTLMDVLTDGNVEWEEMDRKFDTVVLQKEGKVEKCYSYHAGRKEYHNQLLKYFPDEQHAITKFMKLLEQSEKAVVGYSFMKQLPKFLLTILIKMRLHDLLFSRYSEVANRTVKEVLDEITENEDLKFLLGYAFGDYGTFPSKAPFLMHGILMKHFHDGAYYPRGGSSNLALSMVPSILRAGGAVLVRAPVSRILVDERGAISGVHVLRSGREFAVRAKLVVSSAGLFNTFQGLLPKEIAIKYGYNDLCNKVDRGMACFQTFIGLEGSSEELNLEKKNYWIYNSVDAEKSIRKFLSLSREDAANSEIPLAFISFPSAKDSTWKVRHPGLSVCVVVTLLNWDWFSEWENEKIMKRGLVYNNLKKAFQEQMVHLVCSNFPSLKDKILHVNSGTPLSHKYYLGCPKGDIYGVDHTVKRFQSELAMNLRPKTKIPGLYLTGQDIFTCGVMGASISGLLTSGAILNRNHFIDLFIAMGKRKAQLFFRKSHWI